MGEIAEMMLDGTLCQCCGEYLGSDGGYPMFCASCGGDDEMEDMPVRKKKSHKPNPDAPKIWGCTGCKKMFRKKADAQAHYDAVKHGEPLDTTRKP